MAGIESMRRFWPDEAAALLYKRISPKRVRVPMSDNPILSAIDRLAKEVAQLRTDLMERLDQQGDRLNTLHEDITVAMGASEQTHRVQKNTRDDITGLTEMVGSLHRLVHRLEGRVSALEEARF